MNPFPPSVGRLWMSMLPIALVLLSGCLPRGDRSAFAPTVVRVPAEVKTSPVESTPALVPAGPTLSATRALLEIGITVPTVTPPGAMASATPMADVPVDAVPGARAPDFALTDLDQAQVSLSDQRGRPVLLNFWATW